MLFVFRRYAIDFAIAASHDYLRLHAIMLFMRDFARRFVFHVSLCRARMPLRHCRCRHDAIAAASLAARHYA